jgi:hypothetical protein
MSPTQESAKWPTCSRGAEIPVNDALVLRVRSLPPGEAQGRRRRAEEEQRGRLGGDELGFPIAECPLVDWVRQPLEGERGWPASPRVEEARGGEATDRGAKFRGIKPQG